MTDIIIIPENEFLTMALQYAKLGWYVFPAHSIREGVCTCRTETCERQGKHPRTPNGFKDATRNEAVIQEWWSKWPDANIGGVTGEISGIVVLDLDIKHGRSSKELAEKGYFISPTVSSKTGVFKDPDKPEEEWKRGEHFIFKHPGGYVKSTSGQILGQGVDIRADNGYVILPPSNHLSGVQYEWIIPFESKEDIADMPEWLKKLTMTDNNEKKWLSGKDGVTEGSRNETAASMAGKIISSTAPELRESLGWEQLRIWNEKNAEPLSEKELRGVWESVKSKHERDEHEYGKGTQASILLETILNRKDVTLFHDEQKDAYISLGISGHQEILACRSKMVRRWLSSEIYSTQKKVPGAEVIKNILSVLEGKACFEGQEIELQNRVAWHDGELWYDLTNKEWQAVRINVDGWEIVDEPPILFRRYPHHKAQVHPVKNGDINLFLNYLNVTNVEHRLLLLVFLIGCFIPDFPHVMLVVFGAQGSSKSTLSKLSRMMVDPSLIEVASFPHSQKELVQMLAHHYFLFFDNVSYISEDQSDTLCKAITGGGHTKRELYENDEDIIYNFMRCIGMNGINLVATRPDLLERSLLLELERIEPSERKTEKQLYADFEKHLPIMLGGVFDALVRALRIQPTIKLESHPRMADWTLWGCAIAEALGYSREDFLMAYQNNMTRQTEMLLNDNIVATAIITFMEGFEEWRGTPTDLLECLSCHASFANIDTREKYWPKGAHVLSRRLNELSTPLKQMGMLVTISTSGTQRYIKIKKIPSVFAEKPLSALADDTDGIIPQPTKNSDFGF